MTFFITYSLCRTRGALVVEIYPQSENPKLVRIAEIEHNLDEGCPDSFFILFLSYVNLDLEGPDSFLYGDRAIFFSCSQNIIIVWDFVANTIASTCIPAPHWRPHHRNQVFYFFPLLSSHTVNFLILKS